MLFSVVNFMNLQSKKKKKIHELCHPWRHHLINYEANIFHMDEVTVS